MEERIAKLGARSIRGTVHDYEHKESIMVTDAINSRELGTINEMRLVQGTI